MSNLILLNPEVPGGLGPNTELILPNPDHKLTYPLIKNLEYVFEGWMGDELVTSHPVFLVPDVLGEALLKSGLSGFRLDGLIYRKSEQFEDMRPETVIPNFVRLVPSGSVLTNKGCCHYWSGEDVCLTQIGDLVISLEAYKVIKNYKINYCDVEELPFC